jgi:hypothetical protein
LIRSGEIKPEKMENKQLFPSPVEKVREELASEKSEGTGSFLGGGWYELQGAGS